MPLVEQDLTNVGPLTAGTHRAKITKLNYQVKIGEKWNNDGTTIVDFTTWLTTPDDKRRLQYFFFVEGVGFGQREFYMMPTAAGFLKDFLSKTGCSITKQGYDPEEPVGREVMIEVVLKPNTSLNADGTAKEPRPEITTFGKV